MIKVEIEQDAQIPEIRWLKVSYNNGAAWSLIEIRSHEDALQIISALQQSVQRTLLESSAKKCALEFGGYACTCGLHGTQSR